MSNYLRPYILPGGYLQLGYVHSPIFNSGFSLYCSFKVNQGKIFMLRWTTTNKEEIYFEFLGKRKGSKYNGWGTMCLDKNLCSLEKPKYIYIFGDFRYIRNCPPWEIETDPESCGVLKARMKKKYFFF